MRYGLSKNNSKLSLIRLNIYQVNVRCQVNYRPCLSFHPGKNAS